MRYMMLIHHDEERLARADQAALAADYAAFNEALVRLNAATRQVAGQWAA